ncbi:MAG: membrane dipeptidase [Myxococcota bacterium]|nr:membrane dipeptidase [Myxococcota bacterium]
MVHRLSGLFTQRLIQFATLIIICAPTGQVQAEPVLEFDGQQVSPSGKQIPQARRRMKRSGQKSSKKKLGKPTPKPPSPNSSGSCRLKKYPPSWRMKIDPAIEALFKRQPIIDGAFYPYDRGELVSCCDDGNQGCLSTADAMKQTRCYERTSPNSYREIIDKMGITVGAGPYTDEMLSTMTARANDGRHVRVILNSNDLDVVRASKVFGNVLYIQTWDKPHYDLKPQALARRIYRLGGRIVQPAYSQSKNSELPSWYAGGADQDRTKLSKAGKVLIGALLDQFILLDVSHVGTASALQIISMAKKKGRPVTANHANAVGVYDDRSRNDQCLGGCKSRNHTDAVICAIAQSGGTIGITPIRFMMAPTYQGTYYPATENDFLRHLDYVAKSLKCKQGRNPIDMTHHVSLGSDASMNGYDKRLAWLYMSMGQRYDRWKRIASRLKNECNYTLSQISRIVGGNLERVYRAALPGVMRPVVTAPKANITVTGKTVTFKWARPHVNRAKWRPRAEPRVKTPKRFVIHLQVKRRGAWRDLKQVTVKGRTSKAIAIPPGRYRWFVKAKSAGISVNSLWHRFVKR